MRLGRAAPVAGGQLNISSPDADVTVNGLLTWAGLGYIGGSGSAVTTVTAAGGVSVEPAAGLPETQGLTLVNITLRLGALGTVAFPSGSSRIRFGTDATLEVDGPLTASGPSDGEFILEGVVAGTDTLRVGGALTLDGGALRVGVILDGEAGDVDIAATAGELVLETSTSVGAVSAAAGAAVVFGEGGAYEVSGDVTGPGEVFVEGQVDMSGGTWEPNLTLVNSRLNASAPLMFEGDLQVGRASPVAGGQLIVTSPGADVTINGLLTWAGQGYIQGSGSAVTTVTAAGGVAVEPAAGLPETQGLTLVTATLRLGALGTVAFPSGSSRIRFGTDATLDVDGSFVAAGPADGEFILEGVVAEDTLRVGTSGALTLDGGGTLRVGVVLDADVGEADVTAAAGEVILERSSSVGAVSAAAGAAVVFGNNRVYEVTGAVTGPGEVRLEGNEQIQMSGGTWGPDLDLSTGSLNASTPLTFEGDLRVGRADPVAGGRLTAGVGVTVTVTVTVNGLLTWAGQGRISGAPGSTIVAAGGASVEPVAGLPVGQRLSLGGTTLRLPGDATTLAFPSGTSAIEFVGGATLEVDGSLTASGPPDGEFVLGEVGGGTTVNDTLRVVGALTLDGGTLRLGTVFDGGSDIAAMAGEIRLESVRLRVGAITVAAGAAVVFPSSGDREVTGAVTGAGEVRIEGVAGVQMSGGTWEPDLDLSTGSVSALAPLTFGGDLRVGRADPVAGGRLGVEAGATVTVNGLLTWAGQGEIGGSSSSTVTAAGGASIELAEGLGFGDGLVLGGTLRLLGNNTLAFPSGTSAIEFGGAAPILEVAGPLTASGPPDGEFVLGDNSSLDTLRVAAGGALTLDGGTLRSTIIVDNSGQLNVGSEAVFAFERSARNSGTLGGDGRFTFGVAQLENRGAFNPGVSETAGVLTAERPTGALSFAAPARLELDMGGPEPGTGYDRLVVVGDITLGGELIVGLSGGYVPEVGQTFDVLTYSDRAGEFETYTGLELGGGLALEPSYDDANGALTLTVVEVGNAPPDVNNDTGEVDEDGTILLDVLANDDDVDGDPLILIGVTVPSDGTAAIEDDQVRYTPAPDFNGTDGFSYTVSDGRGNERDGTVSITVNSVNDPPVIVDDGETTVEEMAVLIAVLANDTDVDGDVLSLVSVTDPPNGEAFIEGDQVRYVPELGFTGEDTLAYTASDGNGEMGTATVTITVAPSENQQPIPLDDVAETNPGVPILIDVLANDSDPDEDDLTLAAVTDPSGGTVTIQGGQALYTPDMEFTGTDAFDYTVRDVFGAEAAASVVVTVTAIVVDASVGGQPSGGQATPITVTVEGFSPNTAELFYRSGGASTFGTVPLASNGDAFSGTVPPDVVTVRGFDYYVVLSDGVRTATFPPETPEENPLHVQVGVQSQVAGTTAGGGDHFMLSVPLDTDTDPVALFGDEFGGYGPEAWRAFRWDPATSTYRELPDPAVQLAPGTSVWLGAVEEVALVVESGTSVSAGAPRTVTLAPGWNQIGNPFAFPVAWAAVAGSESVDPPVRWDGSEYVFNQTTLEPWAGYFVENRTGNPVELAVPPVEADPGRPAAGAAGTNTLASQGQERAVEDAVSALQTSAEYRLHLRAYSPEERIRDTQNVLGFAAESRDGRDRLDRGEPPPPGEHLRLSFTGDHARLAHSYKPDTGAGNAWDLEVAATEALLRAALPVRVHLDAETERPPGYGLWVLDLDRGAPVPLDQPSAGDPVSGAVGEAAFDLTLDAATPVRRLRVIVGTADYADGARDGIALEPVAFALEPAYPNPFTQTTTIPYGLAERSRVVLEVFDVLGRRVAVLADAEQDAGRYAVRWSGNGAGGAPVASGIYVVRLRAGAEVASHRCVLVR
ncbi:MAG: Ig-like domain-containing protein [Rhodothermales bacterium]